MSLPELLKDSVYEEHGCTYTQRAGQRYKDAHISAGQVEDPKQPQDTMFVRLETVQGVADFTLHMRPDEMAAFIWVMSRALWGILVDEIADELGD